MKHHVTRSLVLLCLLFAIAIPARAEVETYKVDPAHSSVSFRVRHFFTPVPGSFSQFEGTIKIDRDNLEKSSVEATVDAASVNTANEKRDKHLRNEDFFNVEKNPQLTFKSTSWKKTEESRFDLTGDLTINGITKTVTLDARLLGFGPGMRGAFLSGWEATATIDRTDFDMTYGPAVVGNDVEITITIEAVRQD